MTTSTPFITTIDIRPFSPTLRQTIESVWDTFEQPENFVHNVCNELAFGNITTLHSQLAFLPPFIFFEPNFAKTLIGGSPIINLANIVNNYINFAERRRQDQYIVDVYARAFTSALLTDDFDYASAIIEPATTKSLLSSKIDSEQFEWTIPRACFIAIQFQNYASATVCLNTNIANYFGEREMSKYFVNKIIPYGQKIVDIVRATTKLPNGVWNILVLGYLFPSYY
jgi:hypothetical protein